MIWIDVPGWESLYEVSDSGVIRSKDRKVNARGGAVATRKGRVLTLVEKTNGYLCVTLSDGRRRPQLSVHKIVARAFLGECPLGLHVLHSDGNKRNNRAENLRYGTPAENVADTARHGRRLRGSAHPQAKLTNEIVARIKHSESSVRELAKQYSVSVSHIYRIRQEKVWLNS